MQKTNQFYRIKTKRNFIYLSKNRRYTDKQLNNIYKSEHNHLPSDTDAIKILVQIIKYPEYSIDELVVQLATFELTYNSTSIELFLRHHDIEKKT